MAALEWTEALVLDLPLMDDTHREFVDLLAAVEQAGDDQVLPAWQALIDHTDQHFGQEDYWMAATRFASGNCHSTQHKVVLTTDTVHAPDALPQELIHGCGGACSSGDDEEHAAPAPQPAVA